MSNPSTEEPTTVPLRVSRPVSVDLGVVLEILAEAGWLGPLAETSAGTPVEVEGRRRVRAVLALPITDGSGSRPIHKSALIDVGPPTMEGDVVIQEIGWQSDSMAPLFPVFAGQLRVTATGLALNGRYAPPFGRIGLLVDEHVLHFVARRTAQALLDRLASSLGS